jgi:diaminopimelate epimerase
MIEIPFTKLHGAENDFLLTWLNEAPTVHLPEIARRICARTTGFGADGWMLISAERGGLQTRLFNSDGSEPEMSGNGTRCAAAFGLIHGAITGHEILVGTAAGPKSLRLISREGACFVFEMNMGLPEIEELHAPLVLAGTEYDAALLNVGNPQCAIFVEEFPENWLAVAREAECNPRFSNRTNVSFVRVLDRHTVEALFFERGAGETRSSGTGSTGAAAAAILRKVAESPVQVRTPAGTLSLRWDTSVYLTGPVQLIGHGRFTFEL